jgi:hypothetical protein
VRVRDAVSLTSPPPSRPPYPRAVNNLLPVAALSLTSLAGCISPQNDRITMGRSVRLEAFAPSTVPAADASTPALTEQTPTLTGIDRSNWAPTVIAQPVDGTAHNPVYAQHVHYADKTARQRREYPTALSALELAGGSEGDQQLEALVNPLWAAAEPWIIPIEMIIQAPWATRWSPDVSYDRYWRPEPVNMRTAPELSQPTNTPPPPPAVPANP